MVDSGAYDVDEHLLSVSEVAERYGTDLSDAEPSLSRGLSATRASERLEQNGPNRLTPARARPEWLKFALQFTNPLLVVVSVASVLSFVAYGIQDVKELPNLYVGGVLAVVILLLGTAAYLNERAAARATNSLRSLLPSVALVVRDGKETQINAADLVVGDVVHLVIGTRVPADLKIIEARDLKLDFSSLTGESDPISMSLTPLHEKPHESHNIAFMSSQVLSGEGRGVVVRCADDTLIGKIHALTGHTVAGATTLEKDIKRFVIFIVIFAVSMSVVLFAIGLARGMAFADAFVHGLIVVLVANVPQGLCAIVTTALTLTADRMKDKRVVVKSPSIVETLGAATRIASDKTGTLTQNQMTVMNCWVSRQYRSVSEILAASRCAPRVETLRVDRESQLHRVSKFELQSVASLSMHTDRGGGEDDASPPKAPRSLELVRAGTPLDPPIFKNSTPQRPWLGRALAASMEMAVRQGDATAQLHAPRPRLSKDETPLSPIFSDTRSQDGTNYFSNLPPLSQLLIVACCNNAARFSEGEDDVAGDNRQVLGDATDSGLLRLCDRMLDVDAARSAFRVVFDVPFNSTNKWALSMAHIPGDSEHFLVMLKGAPEYVMLPCSKYCHRGQEYDMDDQFKGDMNEAYESFGQMAERVIGFAYRIVPRSAVGVVPTSQEEAQGAGLLDGFSFCGLLSLIDPPRAAVPDAVLACRSAGIAVTMVTGDHAITAEAIARKCHIITTPTRRDVATAYGVAEEAVPLDDPAVEALVVTGEMIDTLLLTDDDWDVVLSKSELVFARTTPQQKLQIVSHMQRMGDVVAVTGDGVNDAPALRRADIGVAMGNPKSSDVAREVADVVLLDDDFASLVAAIAEGRCLFDNLKKTIAYTLTHHFPETFPVILFLVFGLPLGLTPMLVLSIDLIAEQGPASSLAFEEPESCLMSRPPRRVGVDHLVTAPLIVYSYVFAGFAQAAACFAAYIWVFSVRNVPLSQVFWLSASTSTWLSTAERNERTVVIGEHVFTPEDQADIVRQVNAAWYITLILCQFWHIWVCKTRRVSVFRHAGGWTNRHTFLGVIIALCVMVICVYIPWIQEHIFYTQLPPGVAYIPHFFFLAYIVSYTEFTKARARANPNGFVGRWLVW